MNLIFVGPQGAGKGTMAKEISEELGLCHISTGDLFRSATGELGDKIHKLIDGGNLVPDDLTLETLKERLKKEDCKNGIILDGYPRNVVQAETLRELMEISYIVELQVPHEVSIKRLSGRRKCGNCGKDYNIYSTEKSLLPKDPTKCDVCDGKLIQRADDVPEAIEKRIEIYHKQTEPILNFYGDKVIRINADQSIAQIKNDILDALKN